MEVKAKSFNDKVLGAQSEQTFTIDTDNHVIFSILRDKMYSNKVAAVCREVSSNCRDANRENGKTDTPIVIRFIEPNSTLQGFSMKIADRSVSFEDVGVGITPDRMADIFLVYGASTKRDTNEMTGGFGLGAKTPFAYNDTFTVVTVCDFEGKRMQYVYTAMMDSSRKGKMVLFTTTETDQPTGTKIIVPIKETDVSTFEHECLTATSLWDVCPEIIGVSASTLEYYQIERALDEKTYGVVLDKSGAFNAHGNVMASIDGIPYRLDFSQITEGGSNAFEYWNDVRVLLKFDNGDLTVSANREALQYDQDTKLKIKEAYELMKAELIEKGKSQISESKSYKEACIRLASVINTHCFSNDLKEIAEWELNKKLWELGRGSAMWNNIRVRTKLQLEYHELQIVANQSYEEGIVESSRTHFNNINEKWNELPMFYNDVKNDVKRDATIFKKHKHFFQLKRIVTAPKDLDHDALCKLESTAMLEMYNFLELYNVDLKMYDEVERVKVSVSRGYKQYKKTNDVNVSVRVGACGNSRIISYLRKEDAFEGYDKLVVIPVTSLSKSGYNQFSVGYNRRQKIDAMIKLDDSLTEDQVVFCNDKSYERYFKNCANCDIVDLNTAYTTAIDLGKSKIQNALFVKAYLKALPDNYGNKHKLVMRLVADDNSIIFEDSKLLEAQTRFLALDMEDDVAGDIISGIKIEDYSLEQSDLDLIQLANMDFLGFFNQYKLIKYMISDLYDHYGKINPIVEADIFEYIQLIGEVKLPKAKLPKKKKEKKIA